jgi:hypothetical protein
VFESELSPFEHCDCFDRQVGVAAVLLSHLLGKAQEALCVVIVPLLIKQGLLGDFRKLFEPHWNAAVAALGSSMRFRNAPAGSMLVEAFVANGGDEDLV